MTNQRDIAAALILVSLCLTGCVRWSHRERHSATTQSEAFTIRTGDAATLDMPPERWATLERNLSDARAAYRDDPTDEMNIIWLGRRQAYLGRYHEAIATFTRGLEIHPDSFKLLRHRGHRFVSIRQFDRAIEDLKRAAQLAEHEPDQIEPDGAPNAFNIPRSTTKTNIWYHLALAHYLTGDFDAARHGWERRLALSPNDDMRVATLYWLYLTLKRLGDDDDALRVLDPIERSMDVIENFAYHELLLMFKGAMAPEAVLDVDGDDGVQQATIAYGVAMHRYFHGDTPAAQALLERIALEAHPAAFGAIAAEVDVERLTMDEPPADRR